MILRLTFKLTLAIGLLGFCSAVQGQGLLLDVQPTGATTATGYQALEADNAVVPTAAQTYTAASTGFGSDVSVLFGVANLPQDPDDFRAVTRNGDVTDVLNDWIGVDTRDGTMNGTDVTMTLTFSGLAAGTYNWLSNHSDGGAGVSNGNLNGSFDYSLGNSLAYIDDGVTINEGNNPAAGLGILDTSFTTDGSDVIFGMRMDRTQGGTANAIFAFANSVEITTSAVPEPTSFAFLGLGALGMVIRRRRNK